MIVLLNSKAFNLKRWKDSDSVTKIPISDVLKGNQKCLYRGSKDASFERIFVDSIVTISFSFQSPSIRCVSNQQFP